MTQKKKASKAELFLWCLFGFLVTVIAAAYYLDWWSRLTE